MRKLLFLTLLLSGVWAMAQKPRWVGNTPKEGNGTYKFVEVVSTGDDYASAQGEALQQLAQNEQLARAVAISVGTGVKTTGEQTVTDGKMGEAVRTDVSVEVRVSGKPYRLQAMKVDEYADKKDGLVRMHTLFMVAITDNAVFDHTRLSNRYGFAPVAMSVIPGMGQWYKGCKAKGVVLFAAEAAAVASLIVCENNRASYIRKVTEQPKFAKEYMTKADNWEMGRNVSIGVAAGVWIYNIIDAAVAKGARRVVVKRADGGGLSLMPMATPDGAGVSLAYRF